ncbi:MAG: pilus assembly protein PilY [Acinetobacter tjernbergiae]
MKKLKNRLNSQNQTHHIQYGVSFAWAFTGTMLVASSVAQATDMQIYAVPTAGKKTIVMMLDTSGSMGYSLSAGYSLYDDYGLSSSTCTVASATSSTTPSYTRYYCSVAASTTNTKVKDASSGCEVQSGGGYRCYDRLTRLKDGMFAFLDSNNPTLENVRVGLGHFSGYNSGTTSGDGSSGEMLVAAKVLGIVGSTQRTALKSAVAGLVASNGTPSAHAFAEAAAYLMGTSTYTESRVYRDIAVEKQRLVRKYVSTLVSGKYNYTYTYTVSNCTAWSATVFGSTNTQTCATWVANASTTGASTGSTSSTTPLWTSQPTFTYDSTNPTTISNPSANTNQTIIYRVNESQLYQVTPDANSGVPKSKSRDTTSNPDIVMDRTAADIDATYKSPLPAVADRVSCDGQGVYFLSDGAANSSSTSEATQVMSKALGSNGTGFSCTGGLTNTGSDSAWDCMGEFAKKLYDGTKNPAGVSIQTAFVGFGSAMNNLAATSGADDARNACRMSSRTQADRTSNDACSPGQGTYAVNSPGYGNGGFFSTQSSAGVTDSVIAFINNLGSAPLEPLTTGAISVPVDDLDPTGLQPYGYLRALEPNPQSNKVIWSGNLKKYKVALTGTNTGAFTSIDGTTLVYNKDGGFNTNTKDNWNSASVYQNTSYDDGGIVTLGGAYSRVPMPILGQAQDLNKKPKEYALTATPNAVRTLFTDVAVTGGSTLTGVTNNGAGLLRIPEGPVPNTNVAVYVLGKFSTQLGLKDFPLLVKQKLLNYLGYSVPLDESATALPVSLTTPNAPNLAMGGSIHSYPVQLTYSGTLDSTGKLTSTRSQSVLYGTMDGGLHIVDGGTGVEQMVFVPAELLKTTLTSKALVKGQDDTNAPVHGVDAAWVADATYTTQKAATSGDSSLVKARQMNVYGGLRMGGSSYYGLDVLDPSAPKFLFRIGADQSPYSRMGQSWSKPILANVRYNNKIRRVMIVGGGYDQCYENPKFEFGKVLSYTTVNGVNVPTDYPDASCDNRTEAKGNAIYIVDAKTGERLWWASSSSGADVTNANMKHSIVSRIGVIDRDADGLVDHLYFGDLGGQVFRADLNNALNTTTANFGKRVVRLANLATTTTGVDLTGGKNPRFYEAPTVTIHDQGATTFMLIGVASGNRSTPLDVFPLVGRDGMLPKSALTDRLVNNVYGVIDRDFIKTDLITGSPSLSTQNITLSTFQKDPQTLSGNIPAVFVGATATKNGWYRSLSSKSDGTEVSTTSSGFRRIAGGMKAFEEPLAITGNLVIPVYDPQGTGIAPQNPCLPRVVGETDRQLYGLPFGVYLKLDGTVDNGVGGMETYSGLKTTTDNCPDGATECNANPIGTGIRGVALVPKTNTSSSCSGKTISAPIKGVGEWGCTAIINPTRWYEKWVK